MRRRNVLKGGIATMIALQTDLVPWFATEATASGRARPGMPDWPGDSDWAALKEATSGRLSRVTVPQLDTPEAKKLLANPFYIGDQPGLTQSSGWLDAWRSSPS